MVCAEAEAEAGALRKRGLQLERHAQQLRSASRGMTASQVSVTHGAEEVALPQQPTGQPKETQQRLERLPSQQDASLDEAQQQLQEVASAAAVQQAEASVVTPSAQQFAASVPPQAGPQQQEDEQAALATAESAAAAAAAVATRVEVAQGVVAQHEAHAQGSTLQGMVVWGNFKGWPAWPGLVTTEEEMDVAEVKGRKGQLLQGMQSLVHGSLSLALCKLYQLAIMRLQSCSRVTSVHSLSSAVADTLTVHASALTSCCLVMLFLHCLLLLGEQPACNQVSLQGSFRDTAQESFFHDACMSDS